MRRFLDVLFLERRIISWRRSVVLLVVSLAVLYLVGLGEAGTVRGVLLGATGAAWFCALRLLGTPRRKT